MGSSGVVDENAIAVPDAFSPNADEDSNCDATSSQEKDTTTENMQKKPTEMEEKKIDHPRVGVGGKITYKKVRFVDNSKLVTVHVIIAWSYAYRAARISPWEIMARDSNRFKSKIQSLDAIISPVLRPEHRRKIWETRMSINGTCENEN